MFDIILIITLAIPIIAIRLLARRLLGRLRLDEESEERRVAIYRFERIGGVILFFQAVVLPVPIITILADQSWIFSQAFKVHDLLCGYLGEIGATPPIVSSAGFIFWFGLTTAYNVFNARYMSKQLRIARTGSLTPASTRCLTKIGFLCILPVFTLSLILLSIFFTSGFIFPLLSALAYILSIAFLPAVCRWVLKACPINEMPEHAGKISGTPEIAARMGIRLPKLYVFPTGGEPLANAFILGLIPQLRHIYLSDRLFFQLSKEEAEAVIAHELAHAKHGDIGINTLAAPVFLAALLALGQWVLPDFWQTVAALLILAIILHYLSRRMEERADLCAVRATAMPDAFISAFTKMTESSQLPKKWSRADILVTHPDLAKRIRLIKDAL
jgi:Zn-dependent protease with chaperone function